MTGPAPTVQLRPSSARTGLLPGVYNAKDGVWNGRAADHVLVDPKARTAMIAQLVVLAKAQAREGVTGTWG